MEESMPVTLTEVAQRAGVSLATASRAFGDPGRLSEGTRRRVLDAASELGYETASTRSTQTLGVIVPDISNAVFASLIKSLQNQAWQGRHRLLLGDTNEEPARERELLGSMIESSDAVILCSPRLAAESISEVVGSASLVVIDGEVGGAPAVLIEAGSGLRQAVEHLSALGHRTIAYVPGPASSWANTSRESALVTCCAQAGVELVVLGAQAASVNGGLAAAASVVSSGATAVVAYNDLIALGVQAGVRNLGRRCPEDMSIIGIDDLDIAAVSDPGLSSIRVGIEQSGALAVDLALARIAGRQTPLAPVRLDSQLIVRGSTGIAPATIAA
jgi:LacI family transcriptional regulator